MGQSQQNAKMIKAHGRAATQTQGGATVRGSSPFQDGQDQGMGIVVGVIVVVWVLCIIGFVGQPHLGLWFGRSCRRKGMRINDIGKGGGRRGRGRRSGMWYRWCLFQRPIIGNGSSMVGWLLLFLFLLLEMEGLISDKMQGFNDVMQKVGHGLFGLTGIGIGKQVTAHDSADIGAAGTLLQDGQGRVQLMRRRQGRVMVSRLLQFLLQFLYQTPIVIVGRRRRRRVRRRSGGGWILVGRHARQGVGGGVFVASVVFVGVVVFGWFSFGLFWFVWVWLLQPHVSILGSIQGGRQLVPFGIGLGLGHGPSQLSMFGSGHSRFRHTNGHSNANINEQFEGNHGIGQYQNGPFQHLAGPSMQATGNNGHDPQRRQPQQNIGTTPRGTRLPQDVTGFDQPSGQGIRGGQQFILMFVVVARGQGPLRPGPQFVQSDRSIAIGIHFVVQE